MLVVAGGSQRSRAGASVVQVLRRLLVAVIASVLGGTVLPLSAEAAITEYSIPDPQAQPTAITAGPDGALWFTEYDSKIGRITTTGAIQQFPVPSTPLAIAAGPDGALWFTETDGKIGRLTSLGGVSEYPVPAFYAEDIIVGPDGALWFTAGGQIDRLTTRGVFSEFPVPSGEIAKFITVGPDRALWFTETYGHKIGRLDPAAAHPGSTDGITEFPVSGEPWAITAGADHALWFTEVTDRIGRLDPTVAVPGTSDGYSEFPGPPEGSFGLYFLEQGAAFTGRIAAAPDGSIWFAESLPGRIGRVSLDLGVTEYSIPTAGSSPYAVTTGPDGAMWFTETDADKIGRLAPRPSESATSCVISALLLGGHYSCLIRTRNLGVLDLGAAGASSLRLSVARVVGNKRVQVGVVSFPLHNGLVGIRWNMRIHGRRLAKGQYVITLSTLDARNHVIALSNPIAVTVRPNGQPPIVRITPTPHPPPAPTGPQPAAEEAHLTCPSSITAGDTLDISGSLAPPVADASVAIVFENPQGTFSATDNPSTDATGNFQDSTATQAQQAGTWWVYAHYAGDSDHSSADASCAVEVNPASGPPPPPPTQESLSLSCIGPTTDTNPIQVSGTLSPAVANATITISYQGPSGTTTHSVATASNGNYSDSSGAPLADGAWYVQAHYTGDSTHTAANSSQCQVNVQGLH